jgi:threonine dehydrogenase-like Zn-dependent dehydrogenase
MTLTDVFCTGHHAAVTAQVGPGVSVAVVGDGYRAMAGRQSLKVLIAP